MPDEEVRVLEDSWEEFAGAQALVDGLISAHAESEYSSMLSATLATIRLAVAADLTDAMHWVENDRSGWEEAAQLQSTTLLDIEEAGAEGSAQQVYGACVLAAEVEDDFEGADERITDMISDR